VCAREGAQVVLADVLDPEGSATAEKLRAEGLDVDYIHLDVTAPEDWRTAVDFTVGRFGRLTSLVNNAGINGTMAGAVEETLDGWDAVVGVNQKGVFLGMKNCVPAMRAAGGGAIVNISSIWGCVGADEYISY
jgi:NAD(P)-dependent dehydrogenase (short-subunit alcohol dehydrogenase family)